MDEEKWNMPVRFAMLTVTNDHNKKKNAKYKEKNRLLPQKKKKKNL